MNVTIIWINPIGEECHWTVDAKRLDHILDVCEYKNIIVKDFYYN